MVNGMNNNINKSEVVDAQMFMFSQMYSSGGVVYAPQMDHTSTEQVDKKAKRRRRRKKTKTCNGVDGSETALRKRKLTEEQVNMLEMSFGNEHKLESERKDRLAAELGLDPRQVAVWFQNRRARWKTKKLDEEYSKLKSSHDSLVLRNCQLESQVMKLEERLAVAESEVQRLTTERYSEGTTSSNSPMSCLSMEVMEAPFMGGFGMIEEGLENVFYLPEADNYAPGYIEWANLYI